MTKITYLEKTKKNYNLVRRVIFYSTKLKKLSKKVKGKHIVRLKPKPCIVGA